MSNKKPGMTLLEFLDRNGEGLAFFVVILVFVVGGMVLKFFGHG